MDRIAIAHAFRIPDVGVFENGEVLDLASQAGLTALRVISQEAQTLSRLFDQVQTDVIRRDLVASTGAADEGQLRDLEAGLDSTLTLRDRHELSEAPLFRFRMALFLADRLVDQGWENLRVIVAVATPGESVEVQVEDPVYLCYDGSIKFAIMSPSATFLRCGAWCVTIARRRGVAIDNLSTEMVNSLREDAEQECAQHLIPERLDQDSTLHESDRAVVVLIHGLLSTDVGTFDAFIKRWASVDERAESTRIFGWPHDTLAPIDRNARDLVRYIRFLTKERDVPILFVCHSRGGLLARRAAVLSRKPLGPDVVRGAVTFGTPHEGAAIANSLTSTQLAYFLSVAAGAKWRSVGRLADVLLYARQSHGRIPGIEDLEVNQGSSGFQSRLEKDERHEAPPGSIRKLPLFVVGGDHTPNDPKLRWLADTFFGSEYRNDLVVSLSSSAPFDIAPRRESACSHGRYCGSGELALVDEAVEWGAALLS